MVGFSWVVRSATGSMMFLLLPSFEGLCVALQFLSFVRAYSFDDDWRARENKSTCSRTYCLLSQN